MLQVNGITSAALQNKSLILPDGSSLFVQMYFRPNQYGWFFNAIQNKDFLVYGVRITANPNMLRQWKDLINFGIGCFIEGNREPTQQEDFSSGAAKLYVLTTQEVLDYETILAAR